MIPVILPLIGVLLPVMVIARREHSPVRHPFLYSIGSFACFLGALCQEVHTILQRVTSGDFGGIEDTIGAVLLICIALSVTALLLNAIALAISYGKK